MTTNPAPAGAQHAPRGHRRVLILVTAVAAALVLAACSVAHGATPAAVPAAQGQYAALGDSYTAGPGIPGQAGLPARCERSSRSYPALVAQALRLNPGQVRDVSCRGAAIAGLSAPQPTGDGTNPAQLTALSAATTLVTVGIGGNDIGWAAVLTRCAELDLAPALLPGGASSDAAPCQAYYTPGGADQIQHKIQTTAGHLAGALAQIRRRAPHARIYLAGYPALLPAAGATCAHALGLTDGDLAFLNDEELRLNTMLRQRAQAAGATYVDTYTPSLGHDACAGAPADILDPPAVTR